MAKEIDHWYFDSDNHWNYSKYERKGLWFWQW